MSKSFNPIAAARTIEESYREYLASTIHFDDANLQGQLEELLGRPRFLSKGPFLEAAPPYEQGLSARELVAEGVLCPSILDLAAGDASKFDPDRPFYTHQVAAMRRAREGKNYIVVTGTGSGKTECFTIPIIDDILREFAQTGPQPGVRAMILYPMNALANDQLKRLRELLEGTDITFGRFVGPTPEAEGRAQATWNMENRDSNGVVPPRLPNELISREAMRATPPNILLTNYSMLEYMLLRPSDKAFFSEAFGSSWRHLAIDEAHVYSGTLGTEIAYLIRRLKARIEMAAGEGLHLRCYATSATIGTESQMPTVAKFAEDLFGEPFERSEESAPSVIQSTKDHPTREFNPQGPWGVFPLSAWMELSRALSAGADGSEAVLRLLEENVPARALADARDRAEDEARLLGAVVLGEANAQRLIERVTRQGDPYDLTDIEDMAQLGIEGLPGNDLGIAVDTLSAMVEVLAHAKRPSNGAPVLSSRYHSFLRAPEGLYIDLVNDRLQTQKAVSRDDGHGNPSPIYELSVCRHCGQPYILGKVARKGNCHWLDPERPLSAEDEELPRTFYRLIRDGDATTDDALDERETLRWLCPVCGSLSAEREGGVHCFEHGPCDRIAIAESERNANEDTASCGHCGYKSRNAIQSMRVSPEAVGSVVCYDLVREVPPFDRPEEPEAPKTSLRRRLGQSKPNRPRAGSVICFSDRRQDAAFFAPSLERTYTKITARQQIMGALEAFKKEGHEWVTATDVAKRLNDERKESRPPRVGDGEPTELERENGWIATVYDELMAVDRRNSLEGLGVMRVVPARFLALFDDPEVDEYLKEQVDRLRGEGLGWITPNDYKLLLRAGLESLRIRGAVAWPGGADRFRDETAKTYLPSVYIVPEPVKGVDSSEIVAYVGSPATTANARRRFVTQYAERVHGVRLGATEACMLLGYLYEDTKELLGLMGDNEGNPDKYLVPMNGGHVLNMNLWELRPGTEDDPLYRCDVCGCEGQYDTGGVCLTHNCNGTMVRSTFGELLSKDEYYKQLYRDEALPIDVEEHTAQLDHELASKIQQRFIRGDVNVLSCTTTFELGVDVGDLRAIFMRNVPPGVANYAQRAGRTGRRAGMPGYAVTFARLRPHDIEYFNHPERIISGDTRAPRCYLENTKIAMRHVFAIALSEFFRSTPEREAYVDHFSDFLDLDEPNPESMEVLRAYLAERPGSVSAQLERVFSPSLLESNEMGSSEWGWVDRLVGENGRLVTAHAIQRDDALMLEGAIQQNDISGRPTDGLKSLLRNVKERNTIGVLADTGVLPKYGFPTDVVELKLNDFNKRGRRAPALFKLDRGMRQAISEYAPGSEVVAGKRLWRSEGVSIPRGRTLHTRYYGKCEGCGSFIHSVENGDPEVECPSCHLVNTLKDAMVIPEYGFVGVEADKSVGEKRPRAQGRARTYYMRNRADDIREHRLQYPGGAVGMGYVSNAQICVTNEGPGGRKFDVCPTCGKSAPRGQGPRVRHAAHCQSRTTRPYSMGAVFVSDVLDLRIVLSQPLGVEQDDWLSVLWALVLSASSLLGLPEGEVSGTVSFDTSALGVSVVLYDNVPGGAGRVLQLFTAMDELLWDAYRRVSECTCGEDTCCSSCLASYYNQSEQHVLSRGAASRILGRLLGVEGC